VTATISVLDGSDTTELLALYRALYPTLGWSADYLRWQYFDNPAGIARVWVARDHDRIVATYAAIPHQLCIDGETGLGWRVQDVLTHPEYRGRGLYHALSEAAKEFLFDARYPLNFTFPNERSHRAFVRMGWRAAFRIPLRVCVRAAESQGPARPARVSSIDRFSREEARVAESHVRRHGFGLDRSAAYLNWRYVANPKGRYAAFRLALGDAEAIVVLKVFQREDGSRWCHLVDTFQSEASAELAHNIVHHWTAVAAAHSCGFLSCWGTSGSGLEPFLATSGFAAPPDFDRWLVLDANADLRQYSEEHRWHLAMGDSDVF
jgi:GNAT superfamily N-acetyltransferase